ncbi:MAG: DUF5688 family protein [Lachnospiraceae bacterium]|nr:DUF5688 family protein [Lachnospiraceae bacterium]
MEFTNYMKKSVQDFLGEEINVSVKEVTKNNGVVLVGLLFESPKLNISPTIYLNPYYEAYMDGKKEGEIVREISDVYEKSKMEKNINIEFFLDFEKMKKKIAYKLINFEKNQQLLKNIPHIQFLDLAIVFYCQLQHSVLGNASILIDNSHLKNWEVTETELYEAAKENTPSLMPVEIKSMEEIVKELFAEQLSRNFRHAIKHGSTGADIALKEEWTEELAETMLLDVPGSFGETAMYVLGNKKRMHGAVCILYKDVLKEVAEQFETSLFVLPSSVHEVILLPDDGHSGIEQLQKMVKEVNATQVEAEEILSDNVYRFERETGQISIAI